MSTDTLRRWADGGRIETTIDASGLIAVEGTALARLAQSWPDLPTTGSSIMGPQGPQGPAGPGYMLTTGTGTDGPQFTQPGTYYIDAEAGIEDNSDTDMLTGSCGIFGANMTDQHQATPMSTIGGSFGARTRRRGQLLVFRDRDRQYFRGRVYRRYPNDHLPGHDPGGRDA